MGTCQKAFVGLMAVVALGLIVSPAPTNAQTQEGAAKNPPTEREVDLEQKKKDVKLFLDKIEILGRIDKPQAVFIVPGSDPEVEDIQIDRSFFKEIFRSVEKDDFPRTVVKEETELLIW